MTADDDKQDSVLEEAMDWLLRLNAAGNDTDLTREFQAWLERSGEHRKAWDTARRTWRAMGEAAPVYEHVWREDYRSPRQSVAMVREVRTRPRPRRWARGLAAGIAAAASLLLALNYPSLTLRLRADYMTATAESRTVKLADGTTVELAAGSAIKVDVTGGQRRVTLLAGEAFFDVTHDSARPFVVAAGGVDVTDLGTAFNVQLSSTETSVELARGAAGVSLDTHNANDVVLAPGEMVVVDRKTGRMEKSAIAQADIAAWRDGRLFVNDVTVASVIEQLQRYDAAWITVPDTVLASQRVTGLYDLRNPERALRALVEPYGGTVHEVSPYMRIVGRF